MKREDFEQNKKERDIMEANIDLSKTEALLALAKNNDFACTITIAGVDVGICNNAKIIPALEHHKQEIEKFLNNEQNEWE